MELQHFSQSMSSDRSGHPKKEVCGLKSMSWNMDPQPQTQNTEEKEHFFQEPTGLACLLGAEILQPRNPTRQTTVRVLFRVAELHADRAE